jgi:hypothetical protein
MLSAAPQQTNLHSQTESVPIITAPRSGWGAIRDVVNLAGDVKNLGGVGTFFCFTFAED